MKSLRVTVVVLFVAGGSTVQAQPSSHRAGTHSRAELCQGPEARTSSLCICFELGCRPNPAAPQVALPPAPPPPPPPPPVASPDNGSPLPRKPSKRYRIRVTLNTDILPLQFDIVLGRYFALVGQAVYFSVGDRYLGGGTGGFDFFFKGNAPKGMRLSFRGGHITWGSRGSSQKGHMGIARGLFGYNFVWDNLFTLGLGIGMQMLHINYKARSHATKTYVLPTGEINIGFAF